MRAINPPFFDCLAPTDVSILVQNDREDCYNCTAKFMHRNYLLYNHEAKNKPKNLKIGTLGKSEKSRMRFLIRLCVVKNQDFVL